VVNDGYLEGMHAFLSAYHHVKTPSGFPRSALLFPNSHRGLDIEPLQNIGGGVVWAAICLDYPGHSFSELGIFYGMSIPVMSRIDASLVLQKE